MESATTLKRGKPVNAQSREIIYNVYLYFLYEANRFKKQEDGYFKKVHERVGNACGISVRFLHKLLKEKSKMGEKGSFETPKKGRPKKTLRLELDHFDYCVIRNTIYDFHLRYKQLCTINSLREKLIPAIGFQGCLETLRQILTDMGFKFMRTEKKRGGFLAEKSEVRLKRIKYIKEIQSLRASGRNIVYTIESYVSCQKKDKSSSDKDKNRPGASKPTQIEDKLPVTKGNRVFILHAGNDKGFLPGALMLGSCPDHDTNYRKIMNEVSFEKWVRDQLIPVLLPQSVLVIDSAPHHNQPFVKPPRATSTKQEMVDWLVRHNFFFDTSSSKPELYHIIKTNKENLTELAIDRLLKQQGHSVVRLPPFHPDFNPMAHVWTQVKGNVTNKNTDLSVATAKSLIMEKLNAIGADEWKASCEHAIECEDEYRNFETAFDSHTDSFVFNDGSSSESENSDASGVGDEDTD